LPRLVVTADDYGYSLRYNEGILRAAAAGGIDAASAMVLRGVCAPEPLLESGVEVGLHIERPTDVDDEIAATEPRRQLGLFANIFRRPPAYLDGHHHCHASEGMAAEVEAIALELGIRVRSVSGEHRDRLRELGIETPEHLIGRYEESRPPVPAEVEAVAGSREPPPGLTEWMTHPGLSDPDAGSSFDGGREDDLAVALRFAPNPFLRRWRDGR
jgi:predicted glycoside hydrolase/deacetylase ChbG (UPF0249 family)